MNRNNLHQRPSSGGFNHTHPKLKSRGVIHRMTCSVKTCCALALALATVQQVSGAVLPTFKVESQSVTPGDNVIVPITVTDFTSLIGASFTLTWDTSALQYVGNGNYNLSGLSSGAFGTAGTASGVLTFAWAFDPVSVPDNTPIFSIEFTSAPSFPAGTSTPIRFEDDPTLRKVVFSDNSTGVPTSDPAGMVTFDGTVSAVPEPVNCALAAFASLFVAVGAVRKIRRKRVRQVI